MCYFIFYLRLKQTKKRAPNLYRRSSPFPLGLIAGFADATGGGGWGPIATPVLLAKKGTTARKVVGTVDTSEFAIAVSATLGFLISLGWEQVNWFWVGALMIGGIIAAPIAAWFVRIIPAHLLGSLVGGFIILTNARTLLNTWVSSSSTQIAVYAFILIVWAAAIIYSLLQGKKYNQNRNVEVS